jgi:rhamnogalacturonyl hydrolase YesR
LDGLAVLWWIFSNICLKTAIIKDYFISTLKDYTKAVLSVQDKNSGIWFQVLDKGADTKNWLETSCSCLFAYTVSKGIRMGYIDEKYIQNVIIAFEGIKKMLSFEENHVFINNICVGTGVEIMNITSTALQLSTICTARGRFFLRWLKYINCLI